MCVPSLHREGSILRNAGNLPKDKQNEKIDAYCVLSAQAAIVGSISIAAYSAASRIDSPVMRMLNAFGAAIFTFTTAPKKSFIRICEV